MITRDAQTLLFPDLDADRMTAIEADIDAGGGQQIVGVELGLDEDPIEAGKKLSNKVNQNGRHRLTDEDVWKIRQRARKVSGRSRIHELESNALDYDGGKWLTSADIKARRRKRKAALLAELVQLEQEEE